MTKRFGSDGGFLRFKLENNINETENEDFINSNTEIFGTNSETIDRNQFTDGEKNSNNLSAEVTYRLPLIAKKLFLNFEYEYARDKDENRESTFDFNNTSQDFTDFNTDLSTDFEYTDSRSIPGVALSYRAGKWSTRFNVSYNIRTLKNQDLLRPEFNVERDFKNVQMRSYINYRFNEKSSVYANYSLSNNPPILRQLQAFTDVSNPLNTVIGNPNLGPVNSHTVYIGYNGFDWQKKQVYT